MSEKGTEQASPLRKKKARDDGDVVRSRELMSAAAMLAGVMVLGGLSSAFVREFARSYIASLKAFAVEDIAGQQGIDVIRGMLLPAALPIAVVMAAAFTGALATGVAQGGGIGFHSKSLAFKLDRVNPVTNLGNLFSLRSSTRLAKSLVPASVMMVFGWSALNRLTTGMPVMALGRLPDTFSTAYRLALDAAWITLAWSGLDYAMERRSWNQRLKMTKQEVREEMRDAMGNPQIKARVRQIQRAMRRRRTKIDMTRASVLITNPTHYAVALEFSFDTMMAPMVLAKGRDLQAAELREEARWAGVPIVENPPLARSLYQSVEQGQAIPFALYQTVAAILAYLYRQKVEERMRAERMAKEEVQRRERWQGSEIAQRDGTASRTSPVIDPSRTQPQGTGPQGTTMDGGGVR